MKHCCTCKTEKQLEDFAVNRRAKDGRHWACRTCCRLAASRSSEKHVAERAEYLKAWRADNRASVREHARNNHSRYRDKHNARCMRWKREHPERKTAHVVLNAAVRDGLIVRPTVCESCGAVGRTQGHHDNYAAPLSVRWLCASCHQRLHRHELERA